MISRKDFPEERVVRLFTRGSEQIGAYEPERQQQGVIMTDRELLDWYGPELYQELVEEAYEKGSAMLPSATHTTHWANSPVTPESHWGILVRELGMLPPELLSEIGVTPVSLELLRHGDRRFSAKYLDYLAYQVGLTPKDIYAPKI